MSLSSHGSHIAGETEQACAERWRLYGVDRAYALALVMQATHPCRPLRVYYRTVAALLGDFVSERPTVATREAPAADPTAPDTRHRRRGTGRGSSPTTGKKRGRRPPKKQETRSRRKRSR